ncbi:bifunctional helix-turn-helix transcriptional regulator/GNAT family N-acetyltransferase [Phytohabitans suffuscus]|uniref:MarR family transcriptional regulator n=1 Tax=Phytohabitans suffuscus TaxID=624315 RepID=A0A6F8YL65_9ACTN|nr:helix-turn-helix domain-containing GNAT family N-acetyltransferase [Phytohabitans suffuscus]BCB86681.1 MarR family transcriptional regulator [Phytohabitans suffuscus]
MKDPVGGVRAFNRFYTGMIGVLQEGLLSTPYTLTEARLLFELAHGDAVEVVDLRRRLGLDAGYLSRILARFEADGLVRRSRSTVDGRRQVIELTEAGRAVDADLERRSDAQIAELIGGLGEVDQRRLLGAMGTIRELLGGRPPADLVVLRPPAPGDLGWVVQRHGAIYAREFGWDESFEALVARVVADFAAGHDPRREAAWIAEVDGAPVGCVMCVRRDETTAQLRLLLVEPGARGLGVGGRLVEECLRFARRAGYTRIMLWTYDKTVDAHRIYQRLGFTLDEEKKVRAYGQDLVEEIWSMPL